MMNEGITIDQKRLEVLRRNTRFMNVFIAILKKTEGISDVEEYQRRLEYFAQSNGILYVDNKIALTELGERLLDQKERLLDQKMLEDSNVDQLKLKVLRKNTITSSPTIIFLKLVKGISDAEEYRLRLNDYSILFYSDWKGHHEQSEELSDFTESILDRQVENLKKQKSRRK